ncbi:ABC transporter ATP-binding protein [Bacillus sp. DTU_2020_1000418_1_SI_GHA_SEK_038]|uniref:ABC transporter ATP-binding protein n=1 Tax=Bacillus sp. DTU_2020_1000418_1_SI_GHA_SEK_038 TaxID=3077585 RepID=UPI0028E74498|nr:ABC transporter ATP-binding protein [Bacillus sp. DTU_2020_1000418_1_SI_GHA_SEK_038]WNS76362.1 ABC transporter ATP-binding protein [Bacillus sp. DTU_2020_1000418_1_SI_GHA_SEK_038]
MLTIKNLNVFYNQIHAVKDLNIELNKGEIVTLMGSNGAGKSSSLNAISGLIKSSGSILFNGDEINRLSPDQIVKKGIVMVPEGRRIFPKLTVLENLLLGAYTRNVTNNIKAQELEEIFELFPRLEERKRQLGGTMSGGEQQMLAIGRALMGKPKVLMLDEPSMGLAPIVVKDIYETIKKIKGQGLTILLVEQNANKALSVADRAYIIENGQIKYHDKARNLLEQDVIQKAYLGG